MRQLQTDVGVEFLSGDRVKNLVVELGAGSSIVEVVNVFTEIVDRNAHSGAVQGLCDRNGIGYFGTCHESVRDSLSNRRPLGKGTKRAILGKKDEERSQHAGALAPATR